MTVLHNKPRDWVNTMGDDLKWFFGFIIIPATWLFNLIWTNHKELQNIKANHPSWDDLKDEMQECSDQKDKNIDDLKGDLQYIRGRIDEIVDHHMRNNK